MSYYILCVFVFITSALTGFDKVVIWGHKLYSHTHSYIHNAFFRAFQEMGYEVYWLDNQDDVSELNFANALFLTESQVDEKIPLRDDCIYVLHNCTSPKYKPYYEKKNAISLQVYVDDVLKFGCEKIAPCIYYDIKGQCLYMPWATDLLPKEIDLVKLGLPRIKKKKNVAWVGTVGGGYFGNANQINPFIEAASTLKIRFKKYVNLSLQENVKLVSSSYMAPAIVGEWQQKQGYIPCRIFKNISYGQMGITNSERVSELFDHKIVYNPDSYQLFFDAQKKINSMDLEELYLLMDFVRDNHTYINRINSIIDFIEKVRGS